MHVIRQVSRDALAGVRAIPHDVNRSIRQPGSQKSDHFDGKLRARAVFAGSRLSDGFALSAWSAGLLLTPIETHENRQRPDLVRRKRKAKLDRQHHPVVSKGKQTPLPFGEDRIVMHASGPDALARLTRLSHP